MLSLLDEDRLKIFLSSLFANFISKLMIFTIQQFFSISQMHTQPLLPPRMNPRLVDVMLMNSSYVMFANYFAAGLEPVPFFSQPSLEVEGPLLPALSLMMSSMTLCNPQTSSISASPRFTQLTGASTMFKFPTSISTLRLRTSFCRINMRLPAASTTSVGMEVEVIQT